MMKYSILDTSSFLLNTARGPLSHIPALDVMWISFYSIGLLFLSIVIISATRKWVNNLFLSFIFKLIAYIMLAVGSFLMVLIIATWPN